MQKNEAPRDGEVMKEQSQTGAEETEQADLSENEAVGGGGKGESAQTSAKNQPSEGDRVAGSVAEVAASEETPPAEPDLATQLAEVRDQLLRKAADFENFRKRMNQEKLNAIEFANQNLLLDLIPIIDDFERAIQAASVSKDFAALLDGISMIEKQLTSQLESKWGLKRFTSAGEPFDPNRHEALVAETSPDVKEATVQEDLMKGYLLKDRVIRAAKVKVLMPEEK